MGTIERRWGRRRAAAAFLVAGTTAAVGLVLPAAPAGAGVVDADDPACTLTLEDAGPPSRVEVTIEDNGSGLAEILVTRSQNADTVVPPFTVGTNDPVVLSATRIDQTQPSFVDVRVTDLAGNVVECNVEFPNTLPAVSLSLAAAPATVTAPGGTVTFTVAVTNTDDEPIVITGLSEDEVGDLSGEGTCTDAVGTVLDPDEVYDCTYTDEVTGAAGDVVVRTATVTVEDLVLNAEEATASGAATVTIAAQATTTTTTSTGTPTTVASTTTTARAALSRTGDGTSGLTVAAGLLFALGGLALLGAYAVPATATARHRRR